MPFYETVYETGRMSVAFYDDDAEAKSAIKAHNDRAIAGQPGGPVGAPAERISNVFIYDKHPNDYNAEQTMSADVAGKAVSDLLKQMSDENGVVSVDRLSMAVRDLSHPMKVGSDRKDAHDTFFKMKEKGKLDLSFLSA